MAKILPIAAVVVALGAAAAGGGMYADSKLREGYNTQERDARIQTTVSEFDMGVLSGSAAWKTDVTPDLCSPETKITLRGEDVITRKLDGYHIQSKVYLSQPEKEIFLFNADTDAGFDGGLTSRLEMPGGSLSEKDFALSWQNVTAEIDMHKEDKRYAVKKLDMYVPEVQVRNGAWSLLVQNMRYNAAGDNLAVNAAGNFNSDTAFTVEALKATGPNASLMEWSGLNVSGSFVDGKWRSRNSLNNLILKINEVNQNHTITDMKLNYDVAFGKEALNDLISVMLEQQKRCVPPEELAALVEKVSKRILNGGITLDSKGNQMIFDGAKVTMEGELSFPPGEYSEDKTDRSLLKAFTYRVYVDMEKNFLRQIARSTMLARNVQVTEEQIEEEVKAYIEQAMQVAPRNIRDTGDKLVFEKSSDN